MSPWLFLGLAIVSEVAGTLALKIAAAGRRRWYALVTGGYLAAFSLLSLALRHGIGIGIAYGIWTSCGVALVAVVGHFLFGESLTRTRLAGLVLIIVGVTVVQAGAGH